MSEKLDLREWVEQEIPLMKETAEARRGDPTAYKAAVESILTLQHIRHTAIYDAREAMLDPLGNPIVSPDEPASKPEDDAPDAPDAPVEVAPEPEPPLEKSDVRAKLVELKNAGLNLKELWDKFGVTGLSGVDPKDYRKLLKTAEELSA